MAKKITYSQALEQINQIIEEIENGEIDIDELSKHLEKAKQLFAFCQNKLKQTKDSVDNMLNDIESDD
jgi:exodeoxyribonuclease VII small subunit